MTSPRERWITYTDRDGPHRRRLDVGEWVTGRAPECDIVIKDLGLSRRHAKFVVDEQAVLIIDLKSKSGTQVNAVGVVEARLTGGDRLRLGQVVVQFFDGPEPPPGDPGEIALPPETPALADAPAAWRHAPPDRRALLRRIAAINGKLPESLDENSRLGALGGSLHSVMYVIQTIQNECAVQLAWDELTRIHTIGELIDLVCNAPRIRGA